MKKIFTSSLTLLHIFVGMFFCHLSMADDSTQTIQAASNAAKNDVDVTSNNTSSNSNSFESNDDDDDDEVDTDDDEEDVESNVQDDSTTTNS